MEPGVNSPYIHTGTRVDQMYGVGADATRIPLRGWSRWPEILWRRASTRGLLAYQLRTRDAAATIYAAEFILARTCRSEVGLEGRAAGEEDNASRGQEASRDENRCAQTDLVGHLSDEPR